jgi:Glycosyltransferase family 87
MLKDSVAVTVRHTRCGAAILQFGRFPETPIRRRFELGFLSAAIKQVRILTLLCSVGLVVICGVVWQLPSRATRWDFSIYYIEATLLHEGQNPYTTELTATGRRLGLETGEIRSATDPPTFILCMEPFALMSERTAFYTWVGLSTVVLVASLLLLLRKRTAFGLDSAAALAALAILYPPLIWHYYDAQSKIAILFLLVLMLQSMESGWHRAAGLCLALAGLLRIFPLLIIGYLVLQRRWRQLIWTFAGLAAGGMTTLWLFGLGNSLSYGHSLLLMSGLRIPWMSAVPANIALGAAVSRLFWFTVGHNLSPGLDQIRRIAMLAAQAGLFAATVSATLRLKGDDPDWRALSMWIVASVLLSPSAWVYYMVLFFIPFAQLVAATSRRSASERAQRTAVLSYVVVLLSNVFLIVVLGIVYSHYSRELTRWLMSLMVEGWFVSAMLAYLSTYWFTVDQCQPLPERAGLRIPLMRSSATR